MEDKLKSVIQQASSILITSHISPDPDAIASVLLMGLTLKDNFPDKKVEMILEEKPSGLEFIPGFGQIEFTDLSKTLAEEKPDLFILLDANNYSRVSRHNGEEIKEFIQKNGIKTVIIDHHELADKEESDVFINNKSPATVQDVYEVAFDSLGLKRPPKAAQIAMVGLYADSGGFVYFKEGSAQKLFMLAKQLVEDGAKVEEIKFQLNQYHDSDMQALSELIGNLAHKDSYTYSYISDGFMVNWLRSGHSQSDLQAATNTFLDHFCRNIGGRKWGFIVYKNTLWGNNFYSVSFRSTGGVKDVSALARQLNGGGHLPAAAGKLQAESVNDALQKVMAVIDKS